MYGKPCGATCDEEWSLKFDQTEFNQFLFATGDERKWLIASKNEVTGSYYAASPRLIYKSSTNPNSYRAKWYRRERNLEDPWISLTDHLIASPEGNILYGENHVSGHIIGLVPTGANVFIRMHGKLSPFFLLKYYYK